MNPLLFADWRRMNRLFTKLMWTAAAVLVCVVLVVATSSGHPAHAAASPHPATSHGPGAATQSRAPTSASP
jgi:hypothetical protein